MSSRHSSFDASASDATTTSDGEIESDIESSGEGDHEGEGDEEEEDEDDGETQHMIPGRGPFRFFINAHSPPVMEAMNELSAVANEIPDIRRLLDRVATRLAGQSMGRLDTLLLQVLLARVSLAEMQYQQQLQEALRVSLEEAQEKPSGPPPATEEDLRNLPTVAVAPEHIGCSDKTICVVCLDPFQVGAKVKQLPCSHLFCEDCIFPWLRSHGTCPLCRDTVKDVMRSKYSYKTCGFMQLDGGLCECHLLKSTPRMCVMPTCSHVFGTVCMKANIWRSEPVAESVTHRTVHCPLCDKVNTVHASLLLLDTNKPKPSLRDSSSRHPLRNREPMEWKTSGTPSQSSAASLPGPATLTPPERLGPLVTVPPSRHDSIHSDVSSHSAVSTPPEAPAVREFRSQLVLDRETLGPTQPTSPSGAPSTGSPAFRLRNGRRRSESSAAPGSQSVTQSMTTMLTQTGGLSPTHPHALARSVDVGGGSTATTNSPRVVHVNGPVPRPLPFHNNLGSTSLSFGSSSSMGSSMGLSDSSSSSASATASSASPSVTASVTGSAGPTRPSGLEHASASSHALSGTRSEAPGTIRRLGTVRRVTPLASQGSLPSISRAAARSAGPQAGGVCVNGPNREPPNPSRLTRT
mmetsp:Transcript_43697/g.78625  ORF Transcript_43697/g.78625 Transcript_43697/m.78625 type:complete len:634 (-) Transcript_43697:209-2110(-)